MPSSIPDFGCETFASISEEGFSIMFIGSAYSVLPRIAWGLIWSQFVHFISPPDLLVLPHLAIKVQILSYRVYRPGVCLRQIVYRIGIRQIGTRPRVI